MVNSGYFDIAFFHQTIPEYILTDYINWKGIKFILNIIVQLLTNLRLSAKIISTRGVVYSAHEAHIGPFH